MVETVTPETLKQALESKTNCLVLDVRTRLECDAICLDCEDWHRPLHDLDVEAEIEDLKRCAGEGGIYVICKSGARAAKAAQALEDTGLQNVRVVDGGIEGCKGAGLSINVNPDGASEAAQLGAAKKSMEDYVQSQQQS